MPRKTGAAGSRLHSQGRFNEAAARCRGKPAPTPPAAGRSPGFNEAAARCRGKPKNDSSLMPPDSSLQ